MGSYMYNAPTTPRLIEHDRGVGWHDSSHLENPAVRALSDANPRYKLDAAILWLLSPEPVKLLASTDGKHYIIGDYEDDEDKGVYIFMAKASSMNAIHIGKSDFKDHKVNTRDVTDALCMILDGLGITWKIERGINWEREKSYYVFPDTRPLTIALEAYRQDFVNKLIDKTLAEINCEKYEKYENDKVSGFIKGMC